MLLLASVICVCLIVIYYPYPNIPPPTDSGPGPSQVLIQPSLVNNISIEQINETLDMLSVVLWAFNNLIFFEIYSIVILGFIGFSFFFLLVLDWIRDFISLTLISDNSFRQLENFCILVNINQYRLNHFNRLQHINRYLIPEELTY